MEYPKMLTNLNLESKKLIDLFIQDWTEIKRKIGTGYDDDVKNIDNAMSDLITNNGFVALSCYSIIWKRLSNNIEEIKTKICDNFQTLQNSWQNENEKYKVNFPSQMDKANQLISAVETNLNINFFDEAENLQSLENNLSQILKEIKE
ncbi:9626_t:CDS:1 [Racocetra persica]|uniref:9626_t:CDS:1 n=1 Tax=Racocetra persica TaxID=160502 RepID=A0ACA9NPM6_9GLOM|nr:9626_t:CDS:1 [Racocetra persica]